jgi:hypothetical protein
MLRAFNMMDVEQIMELARGHLQKAESSYQTGDLKAAMKYIERSGEQLAKLQIVTIN